MVNAPARMMMFAVCKRTIHLMKIPLALTIAFLAQSISAGSASSQVLTHGPAAGGVTDSSANVFVRTNQATSVVLRYGNRPQSRNLPGFRNISDQLVEPETRKRSMARGRCSRIPIMRNTCRVTRCLRSRRASGRNSVMSGPIALFWIAAAREIPKSLLFRRE